MAHRVVALVHAPQSPFELGCAAEVFGGREPEYTFTVCATRPGTLETTAGYTMVVRAGLAALERADTVVIAGWRPPDAAPNVAVLRALRRAHRRGARLVSICTGAFVLAAAGVLDGRTATTHWSRTAELAARFPAVRVDPGVLYVDHGDVATSGGAGAGIDLCLHLVRSDHGAGYAADLARRLVMPPHREGGQAPYAAPPTVPDPAPSLGALLDWAGARLGEPLGVPDMAAWLGVSPRTLARRFAEQLGVSPGRWLLDQRIAAGRALLERTDLPVDTVARRVGLVSATNFRRRFAAALHTTPAAYRRTFQG